MTPARSLSIPDLGTKSDHALRKLVLNTRQPRWVREGALVELERRLTPPLSALDQRLAAKGVVFPRFKA